MRSPARRRPLPRRRGPAKWLFYGPTERDGVTGHIYPKREMIRQRGVLVSRFYQDGGRDKPQDY